MKHTQGRWLSHTNGNITNESQLIAKVVGGERGKRIEGEVEANALLIAAAPRMARVLQRAAYVLAEMPPDQSAQLTALRTEIVNAIKEATPEHYGIEVPK